MLKITSSKFSLHFLFGAVIFVSLWLAQKVEFFPYLIGSTVIGLGLWRWKERSVLSLKNLSLLICALDSIIVLSVSPDRIRWLFPLLMCYIVAGISIIESQSVKQKGDERFLLWSWVTLFASYSFLSGYFYYHYILFFSLPSIQRIGLALFWAITGVSAYVWGSLERDFYKRYFGYGMLILALGKICLFDLSAMTYLSSSIILLSVGVMIFIFKLMARNEVPSMFEAMERPHQQSTLF